MEPPPAKTSKTRIKALKLRVRDFSRELASARVEKFIELASARVKKFIELASARVDKFSNSCSLGCSLDDS